MDCTVIGVAGGTDEISGRSGIDSGIKDVAFELMTTKIEQRLDGD